MLIWKIACFRLALSSSVNVENLLLLQLLQFRTNAKLLSSHEDAVLSSFNVVFFIYQAISNIIHPKPRKEIVETYA